MDTQFYHGPFADLHYLLLDLLTRFFHDLLDPGGVDTTVGYQPLQRKPGDLPAERVERRKNDGLGRIVHDEVYPCGGFDSTDIPAFPANDLPLDLVAFQVEYGDGILDSLLCGSPLDALDDDLSS